MTCLERSSCWPPEPWQHLLHELNRSVSPQRACASFLAREVLPRALRLLPDTSRSFSPAGQSNTQLVSALGMCILKLSCCAIAVSADWQSLGRLNSALTSKQDNMQIQASTAAVLIVCCPFHALALLNLSLIVFGRLCERRILALQSRLKGTLHSKTPPSAGPRLCAPSTRTCRCLFFFMIAVLSDQFMRGHSDGQSVIDRLFTIRMAETLRNTEAAEVSHRREEKGQQNEKESSNNRMVAPLSNFTRGRTGRGRGIDKQAAAAVLSYRQG